MARKLPAKKATPTKRRPIAIDTPGPREPDDPFEEVEPLTQQILQHHRSSNAATVEARAEQGRLLVEVRQTIPHGAWGSYIAHKLPYSRGTADRAVDLHHFSENHPDVFALLRPIGLTIALFLIDRPVRELEAFLSRPHLVPSLGVTKTPASMDLPQVMEVLFGQPEHEDLAERLLTRSRRAGRRAIAEIQALIEHREAFDPDDVADLYDDLLHAVVELGVTYGLEKS